MKDIGTKIICPECGDIELDYEGENLYECPACGNQYELRHVGHTDMPKWG